MGINNISSQVKQTPAFPGSDIYSLIMQDDFNDPVLDTKKWQYYQENTIRGFGRILRSNIEISKGTLKLFAKRTPGIDGNDNFSSGMISTQHSLNQNTDTSKSGLKSTGKQARIALSGCYSTVWA